MTSRAPCRLPASPAPLPATDRQRAGARTRRIPVRTGRKISFVDVDEIRWIEASGNYVRVYTADDSHLVRDTLKGMAERLRGHGVARAHRSTVVAVDAVEELRTRSSGDATVVLEGGVELSASRSYRQEFEEIMTGEA